ncbi:MAG TPA: RNA polymerase sigma factor [Saprospiraceae bacterium]|nr:RNA polymerase sigma factor [Saprospiraceae bacterium]HNG90767.1 RNA polymerase sigma factor [Saprospiraceae bacterium]
MEPVYESELQQLLQGCRAQQRSSQQRLYALYYNYAMSIARRYSERLDSAEEVVNDAFFKVFTKLHLYSEAMPFKSWFRRIIINTAIDRYRSNLREMDMQELLPGQEPDVDMGIAEDLTREQIFGMLDQLPPAYRAVFNLFVVDGYSHEEISEELSISVGASKSNLSRARQHLKKILHHELSLLGRA